MRYASLSTPRRRACSATSTTTTTTNGPCRCVMTMRSSRRLQGAESRASRRACESSNRSTRTWLHQKQCQYPCDCSCATHNRSVVEESRFVLASSEVDEKGREKEEVTKTGTGMKCQPALHNATCNSAPHFCEISCMQMMEPRLTSTSSCETSSPTAQNNCREKRAPNNKTNRQNSSSAS